MNEIRDVNKRGLEGAIKTQPTNKKARVDGGLESRVEEAAGTAIKVVKIANPFPPSLADKEIVDFAQDPCSFVFSVRELVMGICAYLSLKDLLNFSAVNRACYHYARATIAENYARYLPDDCIEPNTTLSEQEKRLAFLKSLLPYSIRQFHFFGIPFDNQTLKETLEALQYPGALKEMHIHHSWVEEFCFEGEEYPLNDFTQGMNKCTEIESIAIDKCDAFTAKVFKKLSEICPKLQKIELRGCGLEAHVIKTISEECKEMIEFSYFDIEPDRLELHAYDFLSNTKSPVWSQLKKLKLFCSLDDKEIELIAMRLQSLTHLQLCVQNHADNANVWLTFGNLCSTHLEDLDLSGNNVTDAAMIALAARCTKLQKINVSNCPSLTKTGFVAFVDNCRDLTEVNFSRNSALTNDIVDEIFNLPKLEVLQVFKTRITFAVVQRLVDFLAAPDTLTRFKRLVIDRPIERLPRATRTRVAAFRARNPEIAKKFDL